MDDLEKLVETMKLAMDIKDEEAASAQAEAKAAKEEVVRLRQDTSGTASHQETASPMPRTVYISPGRKLERFIGRPEKGSDPSAEDWIEDAQMVMASKNLREGEQVAFLLEHLGGKARREILGRGAEVKDPLRIFAVLLKVFGDSSNLPQLQQKFYSYRQADGEDIVSLSLELVRLFDRIIALDPSLQHTRENQLKDRLAEAVREETVQMELRRLIADKPSMSFFDTRDHLIRILGKEKLGKSKKETVVLREATAEADLGHQIRKQEEQIAKQQTQIRSLLSFLENKPRGQPRPRRDTNSISCWNCNGTGHYRRDCPLPLRIPPTQPTTRGPVNNTTQAPTPSSLN